MKDCGALTVPTNGQVLTVHGTTYGEEAVYSCASGYQVNGVSTRTCEANGQWSASEPTCEILETLDCGSLVAPTNGVIQLPAVNSAGQIAVYSCDRGYSLTGPSTRTCLSSGNWNGTAPQCIAGCPYPEPPDNGQVQTSNGLASGATITYVCNTGYALVGAAKRTCNANSQWSGCEPRCKIQCPVLSDIEHGWVDLALGRWEGSKAVYVCDNNYAVFGAVTRTCQSSGHWDGVESECVFATFPDVLLVFGSLFVFLVLIDIFILCFCVYVRYFHKPSKESEEELIGKKIGFPDIFDEIEENGVPPVASFQTSKGHKERKEKEKREKRNKLAKVAPEINQEILRMDDHPPPRSGPNVRVEKRQNIEFEKPKFLKHIQNSRNKSYKDSARDSMDSDHSRVNSVQQQPMRELREDTTPHHGDGYGTANSDESPNKIMDEDQLSLDDLDPSEQ